MRPRFSAPRGPACLGLLPLQLPGTFFHPKFLGRARFLAGPRRRRQAGRDARDPPPCPHLAHRRPVAHPARRAWRPVPLPVLSARSSAAAAASAREGPARPPHRPLPKPPKRGTRRRARPLRDSDSGVPLQLGDGVGTKGDLGAGLTAGLPARRGLCLSQVFQEGRRWFQGGARNPRGRRVYTDPELTSGLVSTLCTRPGAV